MPSRHLSRAAVATSTLVLLLGATACGGDDKEPKADPSPSKVVVTGPGSDPTENFDTADQFVAALAGNTAADLEEARGLAEAKSGASRYLDAVEAGFADGSTEALTVTEKPQGSYQLCPAGGKGCTEITELVLINGKVSTFKVDGKQQR